MLNTYNRDTVENIDDTINIKNKKRMYKGFWDTPVTQSFSQRSLKDIWKQCRWTDWLFTSDSKFTPSIRGTWKLCWLMYTRKLCWLIYKPLMSGEENMEWKPWVEFYPPPHNGKLIVFKSHVPPFRGQLAFFRSLTFSWVWVCVLHLGLGKFSFKLSARKF